MHDMQITITEIENGTLLSISHGGRYPPKQMYFKEFVFLLEELSGIVLGEWHDMVRAARESNQCGAAVLRAAEPAYEQFEQGVPSWRDKMGQTEHYSLNEQRRAARNLDADDMGDDLNARDGDDTDRSPGCGRTRGVG